MNEMYTRWTGVTLLLMLLLCPMSQAQPINSPIQRVEPEHWWIGFKDSTHQILLYGENIAYFTPSFSYKGVSLIRTEKVENPNYLFVYLSINKETIPGEILFTFHPSDDEPDVSLTSPFQLTYPLLEREPLSSERAGFDASDVIYLITPDRFANGDPTNDSVEGYSDTWNRKDDYGRHGGDLQGVLNHLDYLSEMGYTSIWLNPVLENAQPEASYHGYATTDYYQTDPRFGSNQLYQSLGIETGKRGIKLIMDMIMNHSGSEHWWMKDLPDRQWIHYANKYQETNHRRTTLTDPYASSTDKKLFTDGWFVPTMPDLNQDHPLLADYLITNSIWWIEYAGLDGIRHDTHPYASSDFLEKWTCRIMSEYPNFNIVGEEWGVTPLILSKWQRGSTFSGTLGSCLPSLMDFPLQVTLTNALKHDENWNSGWIELYELLALDYVYSDPNQLVVFGDNHDMMRFYQQLDKDIDLYKIGLAFLLTTRGIPQIYYGSEILMESEAPHGHGQIRRDFPGGWKGDVRNAFTSENLSATELDMQQYLRKVLQWRKDESLIHHGNLMHFAPKHDGIYVYFRYDEHRSIMIILNKNDRFNLQLDPYRERLDGYTKGTNILTNEEVSLQDELILENKGAYILILD